MLLIDDDDAEVRQGREDGRARADDDVGEILRDALPVAVPLGGGQPAVEDGDALEAGHEALSRLRGEGDFGHEDNGLFALGDDVGDALEVDFGFSAAGDSVKKAGG